MIQRAAMDYLAWYSIKHKIYFFRSAAGHVVLESGRYFKTGKPGTPDITVCEGGRFIGIECKTAKGKQSALQKQAEAEIEASGGKYFLVRSLEDIKRIFPMDK